MVKWTQQFHGLYHVLGGLISPMDGIGPSDLEIESLVQRVSENDVKEVIDSVRQRVNEKMKEYPLFAY